MADDYHSWTLALPEAEIPADLAPADKSLPDAISEAMGRPGAWMTSSRSDWLNGALVNVVSAFGGSALALLVKDPETLPGDRVVDFRQVGVGNLRFEERWLITALPHADIPAAVAEIDSWLAIAASDPERYVVPMVTDDADWIAEAAREAVDLSMDDACHDDGDHP